MDGIALAWSTLPTELIELHQLGRFVHERGGEREIRFLRRTRNPLLPVWHDGQFRIVPWGCRSGYLPRPGLTWLHTVEAGEWTTYEAVEVTIPAVAGLQNGVWYRIREGVRGLIAESHGVTAAYVIVEPASYYYRIMTRCDRMPCLVRERI
jgi:hypothetical protein